MNENKKIEEVLIKIAKYLILFSCLVCVGFLFGGINVILWQEGWFFRILFLPIIWGFMILAVVGWLKNSNL